MLNTPQTYYLGISITDNDIIDNGLNLYDNEQNARQWVEWYIGCHYPDEIYDSDWNSDTGISFQRTVGVKIHRIHFIVRKITVKSLQVAKERDEKRQLGLK